MLCQVDAHWMWHRGPQSTFPISCPRFAIFLFFFIFSHKSPRAPQISHFACFPGYFQIGGGGDDSLGGTGRARLSYPSLYLESSDEKAWEENSLLQQFSVALNSDWRESEFLIKFSGKQRCMTDPGAGASKTTGATGPGSR